MIAKQWFKRVWLVVGRQYDHGPLLTRAWLHQVHPPYLQGNGVALRVGPFRLYSSENVDVVFERHSIRVGTCRALGRDEGWYDEDIDIAQATLAIGGRMLDTDSAYSEEVIGSWAGSAPTQPTSEPPATP